MESSLESALKGSLENNAQPVFALMGTTATGKTDLAAALTEALPIELVSVDSSLVYRGMDIGTAKPDSAFLLKYPHALVDIRNPIDTYSAADFCKDAIQAIDQIRRRGNIPLLVGGTNFYFSALENGLPELPAADPALRQRIVEQAEKHGWVEMHKRLSSLDPKRASSIDPNDMQRIQRALEIIELTGNKVPSIKSKQTSRGIPLKKMALAVSDRHVLHQRISTRFEQMIAQGLQQEVESLLSKGVPEDCVAMKMIGYRQMVEFLNGTTDFTAMSEAATAATRQLAKRQLTWLRRRRGVTWFVSDGLNSINNGVITEYVSEKLTSFGI
ncbi:MAG: tRNA (adenosine(37)-N6)-dimethylallyltransferase MiaA [Proteobacteria bacterium]|nr:tRNA (adenosine(37)-N6)-dimethylallyltransferase MiaA [Pseudomonadota bacterium]